MLSENRTRHVNITKTGAGQILSTALEYFAVKGFDIRLTIPR